MKRDFGRNAENIKSKKPLRTNLIACGSCVWELYVPTTDPIERPHRWDLIQKMNSNEMFHEVGNRNRLITFKIFVYSYSPFVDFHKLKISSSQISTKSSSGFCSPHMKLLCLC